MLLLLLKVLLLLLLPPLLLLPLLLLPLLPYLLAWYAAATRGEEEFSRWCDGDRAPSGLSPPPPLPRWNTAGGETIRRKGGRLFSPYVFSRAAVFVFFVFVLVVLFFFFVLFLFFLAWLGTRRGRPPRRSSSAARRSRTRWCWTGASRAGTRRATPCVRR